MELITFPFRKALVSNAFSISAFLNIVTTCKMKFVVAMHVLLAQDFCYYARSDWWKSEKYFT
jgi:hypothetical protein